jgi:hypothetical protein
MTKKCCSTCEFYSFHEGSIYEGIVYPYKCAWNKFYKVHIDPDVNVCNLWGKRLDLE